MRPTRRPIPAADLKALLMLMDQWPNSWAGVAKDITIGAAITTRMRSFVEHLHQRGLAKTTLRRHVNNLWLIGGEIIRLLHDQPALRKKNG